MIKKLFSRNYNKIDEQERLDIIEKSSKQVSRGVETDSEVKSWERGMAGPRGGVGSQG